MLIGGREQGRFIVHEKPFLFRERMSESGTVTAKYKLVDYNVPTAGRLAALLFTYKGIAFEYIQLDKTKAHEHERGEF